MKKSLFTLTIFLIMIFTNLILSDQNNNFKISYIKNFDFMEGEEKINSIQLENLKNLEFKNCKITSEGEIKEWIFSENLINIAPLEKKEIFFNTKIPKNIEKKQYSGKIGIICDQASQYQDIIINVFSGSEYLKIKNIEIYDNKINLTYNFNNKDLIGEKISIEIWILDEQGNETFRKIHDLMINKDAIIEETLTIELLNALPGIYTIFIAPSYELEQFAMQRFIIGKPTATGSVIVGIKNPKFIAYTLFFIIILIGIISIIKDQFNKPANP